MQATVVQRLERSSTQVEEIVNARSRRRVSANLGKTHFKLAPGLLQSETGHHDELPDSPTFSRELQYEHAWEQWMRQGAVAYPLSYDEAWVRWFKKDNKATTTNAATKLASASKPFEEVPREATKPIMSRLPLASGERDEIAANPTKAGELDYLTTAQGAAGAHPDPVVGHKVTYTRARLPVIDDESYHLWQSLHALRGISDDYADGYAAKPSTRGSRAAKPAPSSVNEVASAPHPIAEGMDVSQCPAFSPPTSTAAHRALALVKRLFNWDELPSLPIDDEYTWYGVAFRSKRRIGSESMNLYEADRRSHEEAVDSGGLLMYWYGTPNAQTGHNLATCIWTNRQDAIRASSLPLHARAAAHALQAYDSFELNRYALRKVKGEAKLRLEEWVE